MLLIINQGGDIKVEKNILKCTLPHKIYHIYLYAITIMVSIYSVFFEVVEYT